MSHQIIMATETIKVQQNLFAILSGCSILHLYSIAAYKKTRKLPGILIILFTLMIITFATILFRHISSSISRPLVQTEFKTDFDLLLSYVRHPTTHCDIALYLGGAPGDNGQIDGDKIICQDPGTPLIEPCLVYSFGGNDEWSFEEAIENIGCEVYTFDPGMNKSSFKRSAKSWFYRMGISNFNEDKFQLKKMTTWHMRTFDEISRMLGHEKRVIDVLKMDIEGDEWNVMEHMLDSNLFYRVKHLCVEVHLHSADWERKLDILNRLETEAGFRFFSSRKNFVTPPRNVPGIPDRSEQLFYELAWYKGSPEKETFLQSSKDSRNENAK